MILQGFDREKAVDLFAEWKKKLNLPTTAYGTPKKIMLLGHNIGFDIAFMKKWLTSDVYEEHFDFHYRDTMIIANFLNDAAGLKNEPVPYSKVKLQWLANKLGVEYDDRVAHDALVDCVITSKVYKKLCSVGLF
jgi:DNA polymerase III epsilon subunit-like protein